jgi:hypothetical protein
MATEKAPKLARLHGIEIFQAGKHKGQDYSETDLDDMVRNFDAFSREPGKQLLKVPLVVGHEDDQPLVQNNSGLPKDGTLTKIWKEKGPCRWCDASGAMEVFGDSIECPSCGGAGEVTQLKGDAEDVPPHIARAINDRRYDKVSAEIYDEDGIPEGVPAKGKMLRRVSILGGEIPHVKPLADLPYAEYREEARGPVALVAGTSERMSGGYRVFSEVKRLGPRNSSEGNMDRDGMIAKLAEQGMDPQVLEKMDDSQLAACAKMCEGMAKKLAEQDPSLDGDNVSRPDGAAALKERIKKLQEQGRTRYGEAFDEDDEPAPSKKDDDEEDFEERDMGKTIPPGEGESATAYLERTRKLSERGKGKKFSESTVKRILAPMVEKAVGAVLGQLKPVQRRVAKFAEDTKQQKVDLFIRRFAESGHIQPYELDDTAGLPTLRDELLALDDATVVHRFSEGKGKPVLPLTALDVKFAQIARRPARRGAEIVKVGENGKVQVFSEGDADQERVKTFAEDHESALLKVGFSKAEFIDTYKKADPAERKQLFKLAEAS